MRPLELMHIVSSTLNVPYVNYINRSRKLAATDLRTICAMLMRVECDSTVEEIRAMFNLKGHSTIVKNCTKGYKRLQDKSSPFYYKYSKCIREIRKEPVHFF